MTVEVFNIRGQRVFRCPEQSYTSGKHEVALDLSGHAGGVYLVKIHSRTGEQMRRLVKL